MQRFVKALATGAGAGAAGTTALNALTYLDMAIRGRPSSETPEQTVEKLAELADVSIPGEGEERENRLAGLGPLTGVVTGVGSGVVLALARLAGWRPSFLVEVATLGLVAFAGSNGPMTALGITDPRKWPASSWISDAIPHLAYGAAGAAVLRGLAAD
jgi:hypothetical protein